jgi:hypothetical protein
MGIGLTLQEGDERTGPHDAEPPPVPSYISSSVSSLRGNWFKSSDGTRP